MTSTATHTLAELKPVQPGTDAGGFVAYCSCNVGFWDAWEAHVDRIASTPQSDVDEADPEQYGRREDQWLDQQLGKYPESHKRDYP
jgi:hypothetical protein